MGDMTVNELKDKKLWFLWSAKPGRNGKVTKVPFAANGGATGTDDAPVSYTHLEINKCNNIIFFMRTCNLKNIDCSLNG